MNHYPSGRPLFKWYVNEKTTSEVAHLEAVLSVQNVCLCGVLVALSIKHPTLPNTGTEMEANILWFTYHIWVIEKLNVVPFAKHFSLSTVCTMNSVQIDSYVIVM